LVTTTWKSRERQDIHRCRCINTLYPSNRQEGMENAHSDYTILLVCSPYFSNFSTIPDYHLSTIFNCIVLSYH